MAPPLKTPHAETPKLTEASTVDEALAKARAELDLARDELAVEKRKYQAIQDRVEEAALAAARKEMGEAGSRPFPEKYKGTKHYRVGSSGGFHGNQVYRQGDVIALTDEIPSRTWTPITAEQYVAARADPTVTKPTVTEESKRAADTAI